MGLLQDTCTTRDIWSASFGVSLITIDHFSLVRFALVNVYVAAARRWVADRLWKIGDAVNVLEGAENNTR
jgi:hypothetical protein